MYCAAVTLPAMANPPTKRTEWMSFIVKYEKSLEMEMEMEMDFCYIDIYCTCTRAGLLKDRRRMRSRKIKLTRNQPNKHQGGEPYT